MDALTVLSGRGQEPVLCIEQACSRQMYYNMEHAYRDVPGIKPVFGSLGIGVEDPHYEFGGADYSKCSDFIQSKYSSEDGTVLDAHVWLEDASGGVYDVVTRHMEWVASARGKLFHISKHTVIEGWQKGQLASQGLWYVAAPPMTQELMLAVVRRTWYPDYQQLLPMLEQAAR
jgi:hypothetical protein